MSDTFEIEGDEIGYEHRVGNKDCSVGWCGGSGYPKPCSQPGCDGLVHANFGDEGWDDYWLNTECDKCGATG